MEKNSKLFKKSKQNKISIQVRHHKRVTLNNNNNKNNNNNNNNNNIKHG